MHRPVILASLWMAMAASATAADQESACRAAALITYNDANLKLMASAGVPMAMDAIIAQRRLQEQYCASVARCHSVTLQKQQTTMVFDMDFDNCLRDEAMEKYELSPSKGN